MPEVPAVRRRLRSLIAAGTYYGQPEQVSHARSALAVEKAAEQVAALRALDPAPTASQATRLVEEAESVRLWAAAQAEQAPPLPPQVADRIAAALRGGAA